MDVAISSLLVWLILKHAFGSDLQIVESMGSRHGCEQYPSEIHWISEKTSALVIGKSEDSVQVCRLKFGLATQNEDARLRLSFDFIYNQACGVFLQINESVTNDFTNSDTNREMLMSGCNNRDPGPLFAQPKNFILISLVKSSERLEAYNFRLNISMAEHLPARGPQLHVVIIVGFVLFTVVVLVAILLFKYITRLSYHWHDRRVEEVATRPINIYNSQELLRRPDHTYILRPAGSQQSIKNPLGGARFHLLNRASSDMREFPYRNPSFKKPEARLNPLELQNHHVPGRQEPGTSFQQASMDLESLLTPVMGAEFTDTASLGGCDIPPSYEEALRMPLAADIDKDMEDDGLDVTVSGRLELDGFNVEPGGDIENARSGGDIENVRSGGDIENAKPGGDIENIRSGGDIENIRPGGDIENARSGGDLENVRSGGDIENVRSGGDIENVRSGGDIERVRSGGDLENVRSGGDIESVRSGGDLENARSGGDIENARSGGDIENARSGGDIESARKKSVDKGSKDSETCNDRSLT